MSVYAMHWAWQMPIPSNEKIVLVALADRANDDGECWPGYASLADKCSMSERNVMRIVATLEAKTLLKIEHRKNPENKRQKTNIYHLNLEQKPGDNLSPGNGPKPGDNLSPGNEKKPGDKSDKSRVTPVSPNTSDKPHQREVVVSSLRSETTTSPAASSKKTAAQDANAIAFNADKQQFENISPDQYAKWDEVYKRVDVDSEIEKAEQWLVANPRKRKQNYLRFINGWLAKAAERAGQVRQFQTRQQAAPR